MEIQTFFDSHLKIHADDLQKIEAISKKLQLKKGELLQDFGHTCKTIYFLNKGAARIFYFKNGQDITEHFSFEGDMVVRVESLFTATPSQKAIEIMAESELTAIDALKLFDLYDKQHKIERLFRLIFERMHVETIRRVESIQFHTAEERYLALLKKKNILKNIPLKHIATYLGITPESLSRIRRTSF